MDRRTIEQVAFTMQQEAANDILEALKDARKYRHGGGYEQMARWSY